VKEFLDFLGSQSPYDQLNPDDLKLLAARVEVEFFPKGQEIIRYGEKGIDHIFVIRAGSVEISDRGRVVDVLAAGDTFGHVAGAIGTSHGTDGYCQRGHAVLPVAETQRASSGNRRSFNSRTSEHWLRGNA
jgi:signal-transduction protein with cAMP-binding, CBS, and nucleotidyltransferase domain